ncbi:ribonuclease III, partial [Spelaeicoccus albus]
RHALTHRSYSYEHGGIPTNERLEFLGDAVLGVVVTVALYTDNPDLPEGQLAKRRSAVVNTRALAQVGRRLGLGDFIMLGKGEERSGGRDKDSILADTVEALIGATQVGAGMDAAWALVHRLIDPLLADAATLGAGMDWKTSLQEASSAAGLGTPSYEVTGTGPDHARRFTADARLGSTTWGTGDGSSKKDAEAAAAEAAYRAVTAEHPGAVAG